MGESRATHERGLALFLVPSRRERFVTGLAAGGRRREKVLDRLPQFFDLDPRFELPAPEGAGWDQVELVARALRGHGAPGTVYVVADLANIDGRFLKLEDALEHVLSQGGGALISCVPGQLALYEGASPGVRSVLLRRPGSVR